MTTEQGNEDDSEQTPAALHIYCGWKTGAEFLDGAVLQGDSLEFFQPVDPPPEAETGDLVLAEVHFDDRNVTFRLHARVTKTLRDPPRVGLILSTLPEEKERRELVLSAAEGESVPYFRRRHERIECDLAVRVKTGLFRKHTLRVADISEGGMRLAGRPVYAAGTKLNARVHFPGETDLEVSALVIGTVGAGPQMGTCVEFQFESAEAREQMAAAVRALAEE